MPKRPRRRWCLKLDSAVTLKLLTMSLAGKKLTKWYVKERSKTAAEQQPDALLNDGTSAESATGTVKANHGIADAAFLQDWGHSRWMPRSQHLSPSSSSVTRTRGGGYVWWHLLRWLLAPTCPNIQWISFQRRRRYSVRVVVLHQSAPVINGILPGIVSNGCTCQKNWLNQKVLSLLQTIRDAKRIAEFGIAEFGRVKYLQGYSSLP